MDELRFSTVNFDQKDRVPLVLLHGFLESSTMWDHLDFPKDYPLLKVDLPGHGQSKDVNLTKNSIAEMAESVVRVIDKLELSNYHLIGHSMGGYVGLEMKRMDPRLEKIMLLNSNFWSDSPQKVKDRIRVAQIVRTNKSHFIYEVIPNLFLNPAKFDSSVKGVISEALEMSAEAISSASIAMSKRKDYTDFVRANAGDFYILQGEEDPIVPLKQMRKLLKGVEIKYTELGGVGHMAHFEAKHILKKIIDDFLN